MPVLKTPPWTANTLPKAEIAAMLREELANNVRFNKYNTYYNIHYFYYLKLLYNASNVKIRACRA